MWPWKTTAWVSPIFGLEGRPSTLWLKNPRTASWLSTQCGHQIEESLNPLVIKITDGVHIVSLSSRNTHSHTCCVFLQGCTTNLQSACWCLGDDSVSTIFLSSVVSCTHKSITNPLANCIWTVCEGCMLQTDACGKCWWRLSLLLWNYCKVLFWLKMK